LQLTLENKKLQEAVEGYIKKLQPLAEAHADAIGYAFAVNGVVNSADVYVSHALFVKLWPGLLKGSAVEAIAELKKDKPFKPAGLEAVQAFLKDAEKGKVSEKPINKRVRVVEKETAHNLLYECRVRDQADIVIRKSYIAK